MHNLTHIPNEFEISNKLACFIKFKSLQYPNFYIGYDTDNQLVCSRARVSGTSILFFRKGCSMMEQNLYYNGSKPFDGFHCTEEFKTGPNCTIGIKS